MKFKELEEKLNKLIEEQGLSKADTFKNKHDVKNWIEKNIAEIAGPELIGTWEETDKKFITRHTYSGKENYVEIRFLDMYVCKFNFKCSKSSHYEHFYTVTTYGIKSVELEMVYDFKSETFEDAKTEVIEKIRQSKIEHAKYLDKKHTEIKEFMEKYGLTLD